jgi:RHS repeat-associated protein
MSGGANAGQTTTAPLYSYNLGTLPNGTQGYDPVGNVTGFQDTVMGEWNFGYDYLNRLDSATGVSGAYNGASIANQTISWVYDSFGNRKNQTPSSGAPFPTEWANYGASNRITGSSQGGVGYNGPGAVNADGINNYTLDSEDRVCNWVTQITGLPKQPYTNVYDAGGHRVAKGTVTNSGTCEATQNGFAATETTILGQGGEQVTALGPGTSWAHTNVYADGQLLATYDAGGLHFALNDWLGTKRAQALASGAVEATWQSLPFGDNPSPMAEGGASQHHFTGKLHDNESQLDYFQARFYSESLGRFLSPDWTAEPDPVAWADFQNPQTLNLYSYVQNNPLSRTDPFGHASDPCAGIPNCASVTAAEEQWPDLIPLLEAGGHHFVDQSLVRAKGAWNSLSGQFFRRWSTGKLDVPGLHKGYTTAHRLNSQQIRKIIEDVEQETGRSMSKWNEADIQKAVDEVQAADGNVESFLSHIAENNPTARTVTADVQDIWNAANAAMNRIQSSQAVQAVEGAAEEVEAACDGGPACIP